MAYRGSRLNDTGLAINTEIGSRYDNVRKVADSIEEVSTVADKIDSVIGIQTSLPNIDKVAESIDGVNIVADNVDKVPELEVVTSELRDAYEEFDGVVDEIKNDKNETKNYLDETRAVAEQIHEITAEAVSSDVTSAVFDLSTGSIKLEVERGSQIFRIASSGKVGQTMTYGRYLFDKEPYINDAVFSINDLVGVVVNVYQDTISVNWYSELKGELGYSVYHTHIYVGENEEYLALDMIEVPTGIEPRIGDTVFSPTGIIFRIEAINEIDDMASIKAITNLIGPKGEDGKSITSVVTKYNNGSRTTTVTIYGDYYNAPQSFTVKDGTGGDMYKSEYDNPLGTGVVNKAREADHSLEADYSLESDHALEADKLTTPIILSVNGDATGSELFDGSGDVGIEIELVDTGVIADTYTKVTVDNKGRITEGFKPTTLAEYGIIDAAPIETGMPSGGSLGEVLAKVDGTDYVVDWIDMDKSLGAKVQEVLN